ncbi:hypothetical protein M752DRAFT_310248 [Aspergillus phoenicis ATCC 13157]|uniref:Uncharacterized protein n=1 Tax=Aspergillus phoenicis ATCC 13157 TaxID=1353007 RepID=A0A370P5J9_ASPPH|nr:hypothetical protein M752DRAFT_310248 [Aspergillus phoenicis ATCC 13157]
MARIDGMQAAGSTGVTPCSSPTSMAGSGTSEASATILFLFIQFIEGAEGGRDWLSKMELAYTFVSLDSGNLEIRDCSKSPKFERFFTASEFNSWDRDTREFISALSINKPDRPAAKFNVEPTFSNLGKGMSENLEFFTVKRRMEKLVGSTTGKHPLVRGSSPPTFYVADSYDKASSMSHSSSCYHAYRVQTETDLQMIAENRICISGAYFVVLLHTISFIVMQPSVGGNAFDGYKTNDTCVIITATVASMIIWDKALDCLPQLRTYSVIAWNSWNNGREYTKPLASTAILDSSPVARGLGQRNSLNPGVIPDSMKSKDLNSTPRD